MKDLAELVARKGLENDVTIKASELAGLLELKQSYNFLMDFVTRTAQIEFDEDARQKMMLDHAEYAQQINERIFNACETMPVDVNMQLINMSVTVDKARQLMMLNPPAEW